MTDITLTLYEAFRAGGTPDDKAREAAQAIDATIDKSKESYKSEISTYRSEFKDDFEKLRSENNTRFANIEKRLRKLEQDMSAIKVMLGIILVAVVIPLIKDLLG